jgi:hypothetical protein
MTNGAVDEVEADDPEFPPDAADEQLLTAAAARAATRATYEWRHLIGHQSFEVGLKSERR